MVGSMTIFKGSAKYLQVNWVYKRNNRNLELFNEKYKKIAMLRLLNMKESKSYFCNKIIYFNDDYTIDDFCKDLHFRKMYVDPIPPRRGRHYRRWV